MSDSPNPSGPDPELEDLLPDSLTAKGSAKPLVRTRKQAARAAAKKAEEREKLQAQATAARLAQIVNLHIAGYSLAQIGASIGATADEVDRLLAQDASRYVRSQPALRVYVRNWISERYMRMIEADWDEAIDKTSSEKLDNQDRVDKFLRQMAKLHGADAPMQSEVKVEAAPEAVEKLVAALSAQQGAGYDTNIFDGVGDISGSDIVDVEVIHDAVDQSTLALEISGNAVAEYQDGDETL